MHRHTLTFNFGLDFLAVALRLTPDLAELRLLKMKLLHFRTRNFVPLVGLSARDARMAKRFAAIGWMVEVKGKNPGFQFRQEQRCAETLLRQAPISVSQKIHYYCTSRDYQIGLKSKSGKSYDPVSKAEWKQLSVAVCILGFTDMSSQTKIGSRIGYRREGVNRMIKNNRYLRTTHQFVKLGNVKDTHYKTLSHLKADFSFHGVTHTGVDGSLYRQLPNKYQSKYLGFDFRRRTYRFSNRDLNRKFFAGFTKDSEVPVVKRLALLRSVKKSRRYETTAAHKTRAKNKGLKVLNAEKRLEQHYSVVKKTFKAVVLPREFDKGSAGQHSLRAMYGMLNEAALNRFVECSSVPDSFSSFRRGDLELITSTALPSKTVSLVQKVISESRISECPYNLLGKVKFLSKSGSKVGDHSVSLVIKSGSIRQIESKKSSRHRRSLQGDRIGGRLHSLTSANVNSLPGIRPHDLEVISKTNQLDDWRSTFYSFKQVIDAPVAKLPEGIEVWMNDGLEAA